MIYLRNEQGQVLAFETEFELENFGGPGLVRLTPEQVDEHLNPPPVPLSRDQVEAARLQAYADPITGSDRYFAEAQRETLLGNSEAADAAKVLGMARFAEIQAEFPWPAE